ncbi:atypical dual specificity phosphatase [Roseimicrobium gellanilyticum]|uniref:Atypical dual specificity phosphatase n=1 Tax=Roseimicrobium gellanilyticum TaxID=748857 RepID=A0A366H3M8_9BACT|nr:dual specificity protein phosphatase family protein [Roseimicrobium gellanilyticum]RBP35874.1 atypical dual specificity phosphatase [Roseimicrobium gellanilyticum]
MPSPAQTDLWWVIPGSLAGTSMPFVHPDRHESPSSTLEAFPDELPALWEAGIRAVVSLLNMRSAESAYTAAGFSYLCLPITDGLAPSVEQFRTFMDFTREQHAQGRAVAVHCVAGIGRTGTMLAGHLICNGMGPDEAITQVRKLRPGAVETFPQMRFLHALARDLQQNPSS